MPIRQNAATVKASVFNPPGNIDLCLAVLHLHLILVKDQGLNVKLLFNILNQRIYARREKLIPGDVSHSISDGVKPGT